MDLLLVPVLQGSGHGSLGVGKEREIDPTASPPRVNSINLYVTSHTVSL